MNIGALVGNLTNDMEFMPYENKKTGNKGYKMTGRVAVTREGRVDKNGNKEVDFIPVQSWITEPQKEKYYGIYMKKGAKISVNGSIRVESYVDKNTNQNRTFTCVEGDIKLVNPANNNGNANNGNNGNTNNTYQSPQNTYQPPQNTYQPPQNEYQPSGGDFTEILGDDEIPF